MSVTDQDPIKVIDEPSGLTHSFSFPYVKPSHIHVGFALEDFDRFEWHPKAYGKDYTVDDGEVTLKEMPEFDDRWQVHLVIYRQTPLKQQNVYRPGVLLEAGSMELSYDRLVMMLQEQRIRADRVISWPSWASIYESTLRDFALLDLVNEQLAIVLSTPDGDSKMDYQRLAWSPTYASYKLIGERSSARELNGRTIELGKIVTLIDGREHDGNDYTGDTVPLLVKAEDFGTSPLWQSASPVIHPPAGWSPNNDDVWSPPPGNQTLTGVVPMYEVLKCSDDSSVGYITNKVLHEKAGWVFKVDGECCYINSGPEGKLFNDPGMIPDGSVQAADINSWQCGECSPSTPNYRLSDCFGDKSDIISDGDLSSVSGDVVQIDGEGETWWSVTTTDDTATQTIAIGDVTSISSSCPDCDGQNADTGSQPTATSAPGNCQNLSSAGLPFSTYNSSEGHWYFDGGDREAWVRCNDISGEFEVKFLDGYDVPEGDYVTSPEWQSGSQTEKLYVDADGHITGQVILTLSPTTSSGECTWIINFNP